MREDLMDKIADRESRISDAVDFFGWPRELVECMFDHSKAYFEGPWERYYPNAVFQYYFAGYYQIRQLSYSKAQIFTENVCGFLDQINGSCLDFGCGVGDYAMYLKMSGFPVAVVEHPGIPYEFLTFRFNKYGLDIPVYVEEAMIPERDYTLLISVIDHIRDPIGFVRKMCRFTNKKVFATPCIDETYDRPTHIKSILKDVPRAFEVINEHNLKH